MSQECRKTIYMRIILMCWRFGLILTSLPNDYGKKLSGVTRTPSDERLSQPRHDVLFVSRKVLNIWSGCGPTLWSSFWAQKFHHQRDRGVDMPPAPRRECLANVLARQSHCIASLTLYAMSIAQPLRGPTVKAQDVCGGS